MTSKHWIFSWSAVLWFVERSLDSRWLKVCRAVVNRYHGKNLNGLAYKMFYSLFQAMCGVNLFSCLLTSVSLLQQGAFFDSLVFMSQFPSFTFDCVILSFCSAFGQVFIYHTIKVFGKSSATTFYDLTTFFDEFPATTNLLIFDKTGFAYLLLCTVNSLSWKKS